MSLHKREGGQPEGLAPFSDRSDACRVDSGVSRPEPASGQVKSPRPVRVYIDGFNLYHAIAALKDQTLKWLNFWTLSETFLRTGEVLDEVSLFTAVLTWNLAKQQRHVNFLAACRAVGVQVHEANFKRTYKSCRAFERECKFYEEKQTDVAIAVKMVADAIRGKFVRAILISADSDQVPTARFIRGFQDLQLTVVFPPGRKAVARELGSLATDWIELAPGRLQTCRLPRNVVDANGKTVARMPAIYNGEPISN
ncbi:MAG: NYN domain-containing protein [Alphaproteobacteria bacterium]|nr:NYN domain-containing protein [Alphaproteobacteria bacterium]